MTLLGNSDGELITQHQLVYYIIKSYNVDKYIVSNMIQSLLNDKKKYPYLKDQFEFAAEYLLYTKMIKSGVERDSKGLTNLLQSMSKLWTNIFNEPS